MVNRIESTQLPMMVAPAKAIARPEEATADPSSKRQKEVIVLENRREIKSHAHFEKGIFVDVYI